jgi:hypothetical protein
VKRHIDTGPEVLVTRSTRGLPLVTCHDLLGLQDLATFRLKLFRAAPQFGTVADPYCPAIVCER